MKKINLPQILKEIDRILKFSVQIFHSYFWMSDLSIEMFVFLYQNITKKYSTHIEIRDTDTHVQLEFSIISKTTNIRFNTIYMEKNEVPFDLETIKMQLESNQFSIHKKETKKLTAGSKQAMLTF